MYIRKKRGPKIDPCGTPAHVRCQSEVFPLRASFSYFLKVFPITKKTFD